jgi:outer membrane protein OmpA-like peptidoglycan-associated protein
VSRLSFKMFLGLVLTAFVAPSWAAAPVSLRYELPMTKATWTVKKTPLECTLVQRIPDYGRAVFRRHAGQPLRLEIELNHDLRRDGRARVQVQPAPWQHGVAGEDLGDIAYGKGKRPFEFGSRLPRLLLAQLQRGRYATVSYQAEPAVDVRVALSSVNFRAGLERFAHCSAQLLPMTYREIRVSRIRFRSGSAALTPAAKRHLDAVAIYMKHDPRAAEARIDGYSDAAGRPRPNYLLSHRRALAVRNYLAAAHISKRRLHIAFHGDRDPIAANTTARGRARNRRVEIRLTR